MVSDSATGKAGNVIDLRERRHPAVPPVEPQAELPRDATGEGRDTRRRGMRAALLAGAALAAVVGGLLLWRALQVPTSPGILEASGRIEGRVTTVTPKSLGRVVKILVDEGQTVAAGQVLAILDDAALRERIRAAEENLRSVQDHLRSVETQLAVSTTQVPLQIAQAEDALRQAEGNFASTGASATQFARDADRDVRLLTQGLIAAQTAEASALKAVVAREALKESEANLARAQKGLALARLGVQQLEAQRADRDSLARQTEQARAALAEQQSYAADFTIRSPLGGTVLTRNIELGEVVNVGDSLYTLVDMNQLYLKVYVPEPEMGRVTLGQEARVYVDAYPARPFRARVNRIYQAAEFTPKNVETREERVKLVFPVELLLLENPGGTLKPGMPADGLVQVEPGAAWPTPKAIPSRAADRAEPAGAPPIQRTSPAR